MLAVLEMLPLRLHVEIIFKFRIRFYLADPKLIEHLDHARDQDSVDAFALVGVSDRYQVEIAQVVFP